MAGKNLDAGPSTTACSAQGDTRKNDSKRTGAHTDESNVTDFLEQDLGLRVSRPSKKIRY